MPDVVARGVRLHVVRMGSAAPTVVLVHGLLLDSLASYYLSIAPALAARARVLLYDMRGHGRSEQPPTGYTMDDFVADLIALLDAEGLAEPVVLVGNSYGGHITLRAAVAHPKRFLGIAMIDPQLDVPDFRDEMSKLLAATPEERERRAFESMGRWLGDNAAVRDPVAGAETVKRSRAATIDTLLQRPKSRPSPGVRTTLGLARDTTLVADLARTAPISDTEIAAIACPVLVVYGEHSEMRCHEARLARLLPGLRVAVVPGMRHTVLMEAPGAVRDALVTWLDSVR